MKYIIILLCLLSFSIQCKESKFKIGDTVKLYPRHLALYRYECPNEGKIISKCDTLFRIEFICEYSKISMCVEAKNIKETQKWNT